MMRKEEYKREREDYLRNLHSHTFHNVADLKRSRECGCICCERIFPAEEAVDFIDSGETALCPYCDCDSLIGDATGIRLTSELLAELNRRYF